MKRAIKFRGKTDDGGFAFGNLYVYNDGKTTIAELNSDGSDCVWEVEPKSVGQFTGMHDKNGTENTRVTYSIGTTQKLTLRPALCAEQGVLSSMKSSLEDLRIGVNIVVAVMVTMLMILQIGIKPIAW